MNNKRKILFARTANTVLMFSMCMVLLLSLHILLPAKVLAKKPKSRPNVLLVTIDTLRADHLGCYGYGRDTTPAIDRLAAGGTLFKRAISNISWTTPSHYCFLTGTYVSRHGSRDNLRRMKTTHGKTPTMISEVFHSHGYDTAAFVSGYPMLRRSGLAAGFKTYDDTMEDKLFSKTWKVERRAPLTAKAFKKWWDARNGSGGPWFAWIHLYDPHGPYTPYPEYKNMFVDDGLEPMDFLLDSPRNKPKPPDWTKLPGKRQDRQYYISQYDAEIRMADDAVKKVVECIDKSGQKDSTLIVVSADHGEFLGEHGIWYAHNDTYSQTLFIPLVFSGPGVPSGTEVEEFAESIDVAPTLLALAGLPIPDSMMGRNLFKPGGAPGDNKHDMVLSETPWESRYTVLNSTLQWKKDQKGTTLHDYTSDPYAREGLEKPSQAKRLKAFADKRILQAKGPWHAPSGKKQSVGSGSKTTGTPQEPVPVLSEKDREALKALGYIE